MALALGVDDYSRPPFVLIEEIGEGRGDPCLEQVRPARS
jgi:hypothetical protein